MKKQSKKVQQHVDIEKGKLFIGNTFTNETNDMGWLGIRVKDLPENTDVIWVNLSHVDQLEKELEQSWEVHSRS